MFSCLSCLVPRACKDTLLQALLVSSLAHVVLPRLCPAGHGGAQEEFQLHTATSVSAFKYQQGSRETLRNVFFKEKLGQMIELPTANCSNSKTPDPGHPARGRDFLGRLITRDFALSTVSTCTNQNRIPAIITPPAFGS